MGNAQSQKQHAFLYPPAALAFKSGVKNEGVPSPLAAGKPMMEQLVQNPEFKNYVLSHLDDEALVMSLLQNATNPDAILSSIEYFSEGADPAKREAANQLIQNWKDSTAVGMQDNVQRSLDVVVRDMHSKVDPKSAVFLQSFQRRLAVTNAMRQAILAERKAAEKVYVEQTVRTAPMNSQDLPHLHVLDALCETGLAYLPMFPVLLPVVKTREQRDALIDPVVRFFQGLNLVPELTLYSAWSPPVQPPTAPVSLDVGSVVASSGVPAKAIDGVAHTCWNSAKTRANWTINLSQPSALHNLQISWAVNAASTSCGAPRTLKVYLKYEGKDAFVKKATFDTQTYRLQQGSWDHTYPCVAENVVAVRLAMAGTAKSNTGSQLTMYKFVAAEVDSRAKYVDGLELAQRIMRKVMDFTEINFIEGLTISVLFTLLRISGSLDIALRLVRFLQERNDVIPTEDVCTQALYRLLRTIHNDASRLQGDLSKADAGPIDKAAFDSVEKTPELNVEEDGMLLSAPSSSGYGMVNCVMDSGVWEWEMTMVLETRGDETTCLGVARRPLTNPAYDTSPDVWVIRCYNGERYHAGARGRDAELLMHPGDVIRFTYDASAQTLAVAINDADRGVLFDQVPPGVSPVAMFYSSNKSVRLLSLKVNSSDVDSAPVTESDLQAPVLEEVQAASSASTLILEAIAASARLRAVYLNRQKTIQPVLEFPFSVQVSEQTLEESLDLLQECSKQLDKSPTAFRSTVALLNILEANFLCLTKSRINPAVVGLEVGVMINSIQLAQAASILNGLLNTEHKEIRRAAAAVFAAGFSMFLPNIAERAELTLRLLQEVLRATTEKDMPKMALLKMVLKRMSSVEEILGLQQLFIEKKKWRTHVCDLIGRLIEAAASRTILKLPIDMALDPADLVLLDEEFQATANRFLQILQEQLLCTLSQSLGSDSEKKKRSHKTDCVVRLLARYTYKLSVESVKIIRTAKSVQDAGVPFSDVEQLLQSSILRQHMSSLLHGLALCSEEHELSHNVLPHLISLLDDFDFAIGKSQECAVAMQQLLPAARTKQSIASTSATAAGWREVKASFEDAIPGLFDISEGGQVYRASTSSNTCAVVPLDYPGKKIAWEFLLETDSANDECSVFGAARYPLTNRCYSSSAELWMRRSYNGYLYETARATGVTLEPVHPGDTLRTEYDPAAGTISFAVNGGELQEAFTNVSGEVYPACGSYRSDVTIRIVKVEVFGAATATEDSQEDRLPWSVHFVAPEDAVQSSDRSMMRISKKALQQFDEANHSKDRCWVAARGDRGAHTGVHAWSFEVLDKKITDNLAFGVTINGNPILHAPLAGRQLLPKEEPPQEAAGAVAKAGDASVVEQSSADTAAGPSNNATASADSAPTVEAISNTSEPCLCTCPKGHHMTGHTSLPEAYAGKYVICDECFDIHVETQPIFYHCDDCNYDVCARCKKMLDQGMVDPDPYYEENQVAALALHNDGSLWVNGQRKLLQWTDALSNLAVHDVVTLRYDSFAETISFELNGADLGVAFGPASTEAAVPVVLSQVLGRRNLRVSASRFTVFPAASISSDRQTIRIKAAGFHGSTVMPLMLMLQKTVAAVIGRMTAALIAGPVADSREQKLAPWLQSPLLIGGLDSAVVSKAFLRSGSTELPRWRDVWKFANDKQMSFPANDADLEQAVQVMHKRPQTRAKSVAKPALFVCTSGTVQVRAIKAEAVRGKRSAPQDPFVRFVLIVNGTEHDTAAASPHVKGGSFPVWSSQPAVQLSYDVKAKHKGSVPAVTLRADICSKGMLKTSVVASTEIDISELALKAGRAPITEDFVQPLMPQGLLMLQVTHTPSLAEEDLLLLRGITNDSESVTSSQNSIVPIHDPDLFIEDIAKPGSALYPVLLSWLEEIEPEPAFLRTVLQKSDNYSFGQCERPFIASLLKHGGLVAEAQSVVDSVVKETDAPTPSADMVSLWQRVKQLRRYLRTQKQQLRARELDVTSGGAAPGVEETKVDAVEAETKTGDVEASQETQPPAPAPLVRSRSASARAESPEAPAAVGPTSLHEANVVWRTQTNCVGRLGETNSCTVMQVGLDVAEEQLYVRFEARGDSVSSDGTSASASTLRIGDRNYNVIGMDLEPQTAATVVAGVLEFDCTGLDLGQPGSSEDVYFFFSADGFEKAHLALPTDADIASDDEDEEEGAADDADAFERLMEQIAARARLLQQLAPATLTSEGNKDRAKQLLLEVMERFTEPSTGPKFIRWRSQDGEDRWRGMVEVLRVQSNLKREHSTTAASGDDQGVASNDDVMLLQRESTTASRMHGDQDYEVEDFTPPQAAMQACSVFVMSTSEHTSPARFEAMFVKRMRRAALRNFGLQALHTTLQNRNTHTDHQLLQQLLVFLKPALRSDNGAADLERAQRVHYLTNLEGCTAESLADVQRSFLDVYADLVALVGRYLSNSQEHEDRVLQACDSVAVSKSAVTDPSALEMVRLLFSSWMLHFSSRDQRFLLQCGVLSRLQELLSSRRHEVLAQKWSTLAVHNMPTLKQLIDADAAEQLAQHPSADASSIASIVSWKPWSSLGVRDGLQRGVLSSRVVLHHLYSIPSALLSSSRLQELGLPASFEAACQDLGVSAVSQIYERVVRVLRDAAEEKQEAEERLRRDAQEASDRAMQQRRQAMIDNGVPVFDTTINPSEAKVEGDGTILSNAAARSATFSFGAPSSPVIAAFASVTYNTEAGPTPTGNYFEVTILKIQDKTIGVGFAARDSFPVNGQMPGWVDHSFGYHGDDGRKFGDRSTPGTWPTWEEGDIIGCGFNFADRSIFYTRNGVLLGVAFTEVRDPQLSPVVGFHFTGQRVQLNFGTSDFAYRGTGDVIYHPGVVEYNRQMVAATSSGASTTDAETKEETSQAEEKESLEPQSSGSSTKLENLESNFMERERLVNCKQTSETMQQVQDLMQQQWHLQKISVQLSRFLLAVACWSGKTERPSQQPSMDDEPPTSPRLVNDRSVFGTPAFVTSEDVQQLQSKLAEIIVHELLALTLYLANSIGRRVARDGAAEGWQLSTDRGDVTPLSGKPTLQSCYNAVSAGYPAGLLPVSEVEKEPNPVLEFVEVEPIVYDLLLSLLAAVQASAGLAKDVATNSTVTALLHAIESGSPRVQCAACTLLRIILPSMEPEDVEPLLSDAWRGMLAADRSYALIYKGASRKMPDSFVRVLLLFVRNAVARFPDRTAQPMNGHPLLLGGFGTGDAALVLADECVSLVQELLNAPSWAEVVACHLTDVLRAGFGTLDGESNQLSADEKGTLAEAATAACTAIAGLQLIRPGSTVMSSDGEAGTVVSVCEDGNTAKVLFNTKTDPEEVDADSLAPHASKLRVDLQKLSQPLLSQLLNLNRKLLVASHDATDTRSALQQQITRLTATATYAVHTLLEQQSEIVTDAMHEHELVKDLVLVALQSTGLDSFQSSNDLQKVWTFVQCRLLERRTLSAAYLSGQVSATKATGVHSSSAVDETSAAATTQGPEVAVQKDADEHKADVAADGAQRMTRFDEDSVRQRAEVASRLSSETGIPLVGCTTVLQYCMDDVESARNALKDMAARGATTTATEQPAKATQASAEQAVQHSDMNPLRNIRLLHPSAVDPSAEETEPTHQHRIPVANFRQFQFGPETNAPDNVTGGVLVSLTADEGSANCLSGRTGVCVQAGLVRPELVVSFFDHARGFSLAENVSTANVRYTQTLFGKQPHELSAYMTELDRALVILRARAIAGRLLAEGDLSVEHDIADLTSVVRLLKLIDTTEANSAARERKRSTVTAALQSLLSPKKLSLLSESPESAPNPLAMQLSDALLSDAMQMFNDLSKSSPTSGSKLDAQEEETKGASEVQQFVVSTPHPFTCPHHYTGRIDIPKHWNGAQVMFHEQSATPTQGALLSFYFSKEAFDADIPAKVMYGTPHDTWNINNRFSDFSVVGHSTLFYRFRAMPGSDKPSIALETPVGAVTHDVNGRVRSVGTAGAVGLGNEDNLFALFDDEAPVEPAQSDWAVILPDCQPLSEGLWFFEVKILQGALEGQKCSVGVADAEFDAAAAQASKDAGASDHACVLTASSTVRHGGENLAEAGPLAGWSIPSVIGCLFDAEANTVQFAKDGTWGSKVTATKLGRGLRPIITVLGNTIEVNFGAAPFAHAPAEAGWRPVSDRSVPPNAVHASNWGFSFVVEPQSDLNMKVVREFELLWTSSPTTSSSTNDDVVSIWRPKVAKPFVCLGDVLAHGRNPPRGAIAVHESQGAEPKRLQLVVEGALSVFRPEAPLGFVAMGDVVSPNAFSPSVDVLCLPSTLVERCDIIQRALIVTAKAGKASLWTNSNDLGTFFGSAGTNRSASNATASAEGAELLGVSQGYRLHADCKSLITGEWSNETAISSTPSLGWASELLGFLLDHPLTQERSSTPEVFSTLVDFLRSEAAPDPIQIVPLLIRVIRLASVQVDETGPRASLPIKKIDGVCKAVLQRATSVTDQVLPANLLLLVDLAVEAQNLLEEPVVRASELEKEQPGSDLIAWHALQTSEQVQELFGPTQESALHRLRHTLTFLRSLDTTDRNAGCLPASVFATAWLKHISKCQFETSEHPYKAGRVEKIVRFPGATLLKIAFDRRSSLAAGAKLTITHGDNVVHTFCGSEEDTWAEQLLIYTNEISYVFEAEEDSTDDWGFAFLIVAQGAVGESEVHELNFNLKLQDLPVQADQAEGSVVADETFTLHIDRAADVNFRIEPLVPSQPAPDVVFALKYSTNAKDEAEKLEVAEGMSGFISVPMNATRMQVVAWRTGGAEEAVDAAAIGFRCKLSFAYKSCDQASRFQALLKEAINNGRPTPRDMATLSSAWTRADDQSLLEILNSVDCPVNDLLNEPKVLSLPRLQLSYQNPRLAKFSMLELHVRASLLQHFNTLLATVLAHVNVRSDDPKSLGARVRASNNYVFLKIKEPLLEEGIGASTVGASGVSIVLDNFKATQSADRRDRDPTTSQCTFAQAYHQLKSKDASTFRCSYGSERIFSITFQGESGIDAGGVFREGVSRIVEDLFSENFSLLILCPNGQHGVYVNTEKYVPNPSQSSPLALSMFEFMGRLMGMSLRATLSLPFELPSIVWKQFVGEAVTTEDLMAIDATTCRLLEGVRNCEEDGIEDQDTFSAKYQDKLRFVYTGSDGVEHELMPGGRDRIVTFESRFEFCSLVETKRLHEFDKQVAAIARGLEDVLPMRLLQLFSWSQLETLVAGSPKVDLTLWKASTTSSVPAKVLTLFWQVMETLTPQEHAGFIRFAWGRSRLPRAKQFHTNMTLTDAGSAKLPVSHTCFFSVELPAYSTEEEMRHGLLTAIHYGVGGVLNS